MMNRNVDEFVLATNADPASWGKNTDAGRQIADDEYFPRTSATGVDAELALAAKVMGRLQIRAGMAIELYGYALEPEPGDANVAGSALDQYLRYFVSVGYGR